MVKSYHNNNMKPIKQIPNSELYFNLRQLSEVAKVVAYARDEYEAEYFTINYLRPILEKTEKLLNNEQQVD